MPKTEQFLSFSVDACKKRWKGIKYTYFHHRRNRKMGTGSSASDKPVKWNLYERLSFLDRVVQERSSKNTLNFDGSQLSEIESESVDNNESNLSVDDTGPEELLDPSSSSALDSDNQSYPNVRESDTISTTTASRCSSAASSTAISARPNMKRSRSNDPKEAYLKRFEDRAQKRTEILQALQKQTEAPELDDLDLFMKSISLTVKTLPKPLINEAKLGILTLVTNLESRAMSFHTNQAHQYNSRYNLSANNRLGNYYQSYNPHTQQPSSPIPSSQPPTV
ncbi:uncharacterized protein [Leptinotarsa decemlineata]|uniref:uncharacterized protein n=1 Tax=Leptinotarsa decemlineata TaxID=7539 RepID=UPI003D307FC8